MWKGWQQYACDTSICNWKSSEIIICLFTSTTDRAVYNYHDQLAKDKC